MRRFLLCAGMVGLIFVACYAFTSGQQPAQPHLLGVPNDFKAKAIKAFREHPQAFNAVAPGIAEQDNRRENVRLYEACPSLWPGPQETGDCVSMGKSNADFVRQWLTARKNKVAGPASQPFPPYTYGITRVQIGNNSPPCRSAGAYPSYAVDGGKQFGYVLTHEAEKLGYKYSGRLADDWGCKGPPRELITLGKTRSGGDAYPIRSTDEWRDAICNTYPCTVAIPWCPGRVYKAADGRSCMAFDGRNLGGHQICSIGYDGSTGKPYWLLFNSHGANWPAGATHSDGTPAGSIWVDEKWAEWIIANGELWAISDVPGFEADKLDPSIFDELKISRAQESQSKGKSHVATLAP